MWNDLFAKSRSTPPRRRRKIFAGAEPLESRTLLSAVTPDLTAPFAAAIDPQDLAPPVPAEVSSNNAATVRITNEPLFNFNRAPASMGSLDFAADSMSIGAGLSSLINYLSSLPSTSSEKLTERFSIMNDRSFSESLTTSFVNSIEVRVAETGQVLSTGTASSVHDDNGLTISDGHGPTTYLRTTDADGRVQSRLVFVTRAPNAVPVAEPNAPITPVGVVVADAEFSGQSSLDGSTSRADLHDFATALNLKSDSSPTPAPTESAETMVLAANGIVRKAPATATSTIQRSLVPTSANNAVIDSHEVRRVREIFPASRLGDDHDNQTESSSPVIPVFEPTTRNLVLSVCLVGSLARVAARYRRRQRVATAMT